YTQMIVGKKEFSLCEARVNCETPLLGKAGVAALGKKKVRSFLSERRRGGSFKPPIIDSRTSRRGKTEHGRLEIGRILESQIRKQKSQAGLSSLKFLFFGFEIQGFVHFRILRCSSFNFCIFMFSGNRRGGWFKPPIIGS